MKVLFSTQSTVHYDGRYYYSNPIQAEYKRYLVLSEEITVLCHQAKVKETSHARIDDIIKNYVIAYKINSLYALFHNYFINKRLVREEVMKADVCVVHLPSDHGNLVVKYAKKYGKPYMTVICGCPWDSYWYYDWRGKIVAPYEFFSLRRTQKDAPYSMYVTNSFLQKRYPTSGISVGCSNVNILTGLRGVLEKRIERIKQISDMSNHVIRIGTAAAIDVPYKGQQYIIEALALLQKKGFHFEYHLIGRGDDMRLRNLAGKLGVLNLVFFHGILPHDEVPSFLDSIDIYVQPSKQEGLPRSLIEAMSRGCFCLGSRTAGIPELLDSKYIFKKGDVNSIVRLLSQISKEDMLKQAERNFEEAKKYDKYTLEKVRENFIKEFKKYVEKNIV